MNSNSLIDECRKAFEEWHDAKYLLPAQRRDIPPGYQNDITDAMWEGWQAAWEAKQ